MARVGAGKTAMMYAAQQALARRNLRAKSAPSAGPTPLSLADLWLLEDANNLAEIGRR